VVTICRHTLPCRAIAGEQHSVQPATPPLAEASRLRAPQAVRTHARQRRITHSGQHALLKGLPRQVTLAQHRAVALLQEIAGPRCGERWHAINDRPGRPPAGTCAHPCISLLGPVWWTGASDPGRSTAPAPSSPRLPARSGTGLEPRDACPHRGELADEEVRSDERWPLAAYDQFASHLPCIRSARRCAPVQRRSDGCVRPCCQLGLQRTRALSSGADRNPAYSARRCGLPWPPARPINSHLRDN